jgi:hypothetical protein
MMKMTQSGQPQNALFFLLVFLSFCFLESRLLDHDKSFCARQMVAPVCAQKLNADASEGATKLLRALDLRCHVARVVRTSNKLMHANRADS